MTAGERAKEFITLFDRMFWNRFARWKTEWKPLVWILAGFLACFYLPVGKARFDGAVTESFDLVKWYAREHVLLCLIPAFFIAGAIGAFVSQASVMKYLGARANRVLAYGVASVSGTILAVCSCTVLPLFGGIYKRGAGLGPASAFLYSGPAINVLAIILTARILGLELGVARARRRHRVQPLHRTPDGVYFPQASAPKPKRNCAPEPPATQRPLWHNSRQFRRDDRCSCVCQLGQTRNGARLLVRRLVGEMVDHGAFRRAFCRGSNKMVWNEDRAGGNRGGRDAGCRANLAARTAHPLRRGFCRADSANQF
jgi:hypothetical protein